MHTEIIISLPHFFAIFPVMIAHGNATNWVTRSASKRPVDASPKDFAYIDALSMIV